jgi:hypothetical protein
MPRGVVVDDADNAYIGTNRVLKIAPGAASVTVIAGSVLSAPGSADGIGTNARFDGPAGLGLDNFGNLWVADLLNAIIRKISPSRQVTTVAGLASPGSANGTGNAAHFSQPSAVAVDTAGNAYVADTTNHTIRKITPAGVVTTVAGSAGNWGNVNGTGNAARFNSMKGIAVDAIGNVFVADTNNQSIRKITPQGNVTTIADLTPFYDLPEGVTVDSHSNLFVTATFSNVILKITPAGVVTTFAGQRGAGAGFVDGTGDAARFQKSFSYHGG